jgi:hypothetical protein
LKRRAIQQENVAGESMARRTLQREEDPDSEEDALLVALAFFVMLVVFIVLIRPYLFG